MKTSEINTVIKAVCISLITCFNSVTVQGFSLLQYLQFGQWENCSYRILVLRVITKIGVRKVKDLKPLIRLGTH